MSGHDVELGSDSGCGVVDAVDEWRDAVRTGSGIVFGGGRSAMRGSYLRSGKDRASPLGRKDSIRGWQPMRGRG